MRLCEPQRELQLSSALRFFIATVIHLPLEKLQKLFVSHLNGLLPTAGHHGTGHIWSLVSDAGKCPQRTWRSLERANSKPTEHLATSSVSIENTATLPCQHCLAKRIEGANGMARYHFDSCDELGLWPDEEGLELRDLEAARKEVTPSLGEMAKAMKTKFNVRSRLAIQVRVGNEPILTVELQYDMRPGGCC